MQQISVTVSANADVIYNTEKPAGINHLVADLTKARQLLKFKPHVSLAEGLRRFVHEDARFGHRRRAPDMVHA